MIAGMQFSLAVAITDFSTSPPLRLEIDRYMDLFYAVELTTKSNPLFITYKDTFFILYFENGKECLQHDNI